MAGKGKHNRPKVVPGRGNVSLGESDQIVDIAPDINLIFQQDGDIVSVVATNPYYYEYDFNSAELSLPDQYQHIVAKLTEVLDAGKNYDLYELAHCGHELYLKIVGHDEIRTQIFEAENSDKVLRIDITSRKFTFPFGLLYTRDPDQILDARFFLGVGHIVNRIPRERDFLKTRPALICDGDPGISWAVNSDLQHATLYEVPRLKQLARSRFACHRSSVSPLGEFRKVAGGKGYAELRAKLKSQGSRIIHFACHGRKGAGGEPAGFIIDSNFEVSTIMLEKSNFTLERSPIIFLNACEMAFDSADSFHCFVQPFFKMNAKAIVAPECPINDSSATYFANAFYKYFVRQHHMVADAVWLARQERLVRGDYTGLAYSVFGQPEAYIAPKAIAC
jgi:hypothetical protein